MKTNKEHFYVSRTGAIFSIYKLNTNWYIMGAINKRILPMMSSLNFKDITKFAKNELGLVRLSK